MNTYEGYLKSEAGNTLPIEEAMKIYADIVASVQKCSDEYKEELFNDMLAAACKYAAIRCEWEFMTRDKRAEADQGRSRTHNAYIDSLNILARLIRNDGGDASWRDQLGEERKKIGDFACFIAYITGINNR